MKNIETINNFWQLTPKLAISGQPKLNDLELLADAEYQTIVNLVADEEACSQADEGSWVKQLGMFYISVPINFKKPQSRDFLRFLNGMNLQQDKKILVHCDNNRRASVLAVLYLIMSEQVSQLDGWNMIHEFWQPDLTWESFFYQELNNYFKIKDELSEPEFI